MKKLSEFKCPPAKKKTGEKYCRLCEKREKRGTCGYGGDRFWYGCLILLMLAMPLLIDDFYLGEISYIFSRII